MEETLLDIIQKGVVRSAEKISAISGKRWDIHVISIETGSGERFRSILARDTREHLGMSFSSPGERFLVIFSDDSERALLNDDRPDRREGRPTGPELDDSVLEETANILINGLAGALADRQGMSRILSAPKPLRGKKSDIYAHAFGDLPCLGGGTMINALIHISSPSLAADCTLMARLDPLDVNFLMNTDPDALPGFEIG